MFFTHTGNWVVPNTHSYQPAAWLPLQTCGKGEDLCSIQLHTVVLSSWASFPGDRLSIQWHSVRKVPSHKNEWTSSVPRCLQYCGCTLPSTLQNSFPLNQLNQLSENLALQRNHIPDSKVILGKLIGIYLKCHLRNFICREHFFRFPSGLLCPLLEFFPQALLFLSGHGY